MVKDKSHKMHQDFFHTVSQLSPEQLANVPVHYQFTPEQLPYWDSQTERRGRLTVPLGLTHNTLSKSALLGLTHNTLSKSAILGLTHNTLSESALCVLKHCCMFVQSDMHAGLTC